MPDRARQPSMECDAPVHVTAMPNGPACNLDCAYCYYLDTAALYPERSSSKMSLETLEAFTEQYIEAHPGPEVTFTWQGGEPTLRGLEFYRRAVEFQRQYAPATTRVVNTFQTNGTRLDDDWCRFFAANDFLVGISIDGPPALHDRYRRTPAGGPTFEAVEAGLSRLQNHGVEHNVLCVVTALNSQYPRRVYEFFAELGVDWLQFIPLVEPRDGAAGPPPGTGPTDRDGTAGPDPEPSWPAHDWVRERHTPAAASDADSVLDRAREAPVTDRSVDPAAYGAFMQAIFEHWVRNDVGERSVRLFEHCVQVALGGPARSCVLSETCGTQVALEHTGDVYACDHYVEPAFHRGNIHDEHLATMVDSDTQRAFGRDKREGLPERCRRCPVREFCHGGCPKDRHLKTPRESGLNYLCAGYRRFFTHVQPYLELFERTIDAGKPPAFVMDAVAALDDRG
ncbi:anaerobic sulfatase maturase [Halococcoides cellulosivorans]|uniref:anaerobic sulfatase maturase n=1 Tax=Halococcoides cellulosivorans TaxID=1679096 RepID=UPI00131ED785|nr:anaerobic sulfatase maturase [Halococcoides cellulosivorans]